MGMTVNAIPGIRIAGAANAWPEELLGESARLTNDEVYRSLLGGDWRQQLSERDWDASKISDVYGVQFRGWTRGSDIGSLELSIAAAEKALSQSGFVASDLDCIISATCSPHQITSTLSGKIANHLKSTAAAFDIRAGGAGGLNAMITAALYHNNGCKVSLVISAESSSKYIGAHDLANSLLFGDGASAMVLVSDESAGDSGLVGAVMANSSWIGKAFTVPGILPPTKMTKTEEYLFQSPDKEYLHCLADAWIKAGESLRNSFPEQCKSLAAVLPYAVTKDQVNAVATSFDSPSDISQSLLLNHGCIGCASPMAALVHYIEQAGSSGRHKVVGSLAVAGGISCAGMLWRF